MAYIVFKDKLHQVVFRMKQKSKYLGKRGSDYKWLEIHRKHFVCGMVGNGEPRVIRREKRSEVFIGAHSEHLIIGPFQTCICSGDAWGTQSAE